jgi:serine/threonine-protein kinase
MGDVIVKICTEPIPSVASFRPDLGPEVDAFFTRAFGRKPDERFATARELAQAFAALAGGSGSELSSAGIPLRAMASAISSSGAIDGRASTVPTGGTPPPPQRDAVTMTGSDLHTSATASGPVSTGSPLALGLRVSDPPATPPVAPIYPAPPVSTGTFSTGSQISDVSPALPARPAPRRTMLVAAVAGAVALAIGGLVMFGGGRAAPVATGGAASPVAPTAPPPVTAAAASVTAAAPSVTAAPTPSSTPTAAPSATGTASASASATASAAAPRAAPPKAPRGGAPAKDINSELGF